MSIVLITIPGEPKRQFANDLHQASEQAVELVIVQTRASESMFTRVTKFIADHRLRCIFELWYAIKLRFNHEAQVMLQSFTRSGGDGAGTYLAPTLEVTSVNSNEVYEALRQIKPDLLVVWGSGVLQPHIVATAKRAINLHLGLCPYYRGALANQYAVFCDDYEHLGATVHYINGKPDAGDILATERMNHALRPPELFYDLHDRAAHTFLHTAVALHNGKDLPATPQDVSESKNFLLKDWSPSVRYQVATKLRKWRDRGSQI